MSKVIIQKEKLCVCFSVCYFLLAVYMYMQYMLHVHIKSKYKLIDIKLK